MSITIDKDFPGGNIIVESISGNDVILTPELRDTDGLWFYWSCRVRGAAGQKLHFKVRFPQAPEYPTLSTIGPAFCNNNGEWQWNPLGKSSNNSFEYQFAADENEVFFSNTIPYTEKNWQDFLQKYKLADSELCRSEAGRRVEKLELQKGLPKTQFLITARHHCCETIANFALEGMALELLQNCADFSLLMIPFVDKDGCEEGDQGKNRKPFDHNRDYQPNNSIYASVRNLREYVKDWLIPDSKLFAFDMHCPWIDGDDFPHWVGKNKVLGVCEKQYKFAKALAKTQKAGFAFQANSGIPFGIGWNCGERPTASNWFASLPNIELPMSIETPYALCANKCKVYDYDTGESAMIEIPEMPKEGLKISAEGTRNWGRDIIRASQECLA